MDITIKATAASFSFLPAKDNMQPFASLRVARDTYSTSEKDPETGKMKKLYTTWIDIVADGLLAELMNAKIKRGDLLEVSGNLVNRTSKVKFDEENTKEIQVLKLKATSFEVLATKKVEPEAQKPKRSRQKAA